MRSAIDLEMRTKYYMKTEMGTDIAIFLEYVVETIDGGEKDCGYMVMQRIATHAKMWKWSMEKMYCKVRRNWCHC